MDEMIAYTGFGPKDVARLAMAWPVVEPHTGAISDAFYERVLEFDEAREVFEDLAQVNRLKRTLQVWLKELMKGPHDEAYFERRARIGRKHVDVALPHRYMFTSMSVVRHEVRKLLFAALSVEEALETAAAFERMSNIDLAIMTGTYMRSREELQLDTLQDLVVSHLPVAVLLVRSDGVVAAATRPGSRLFGGDGVSGQHYTDVLPKTLVEAADLPWHVQRAVAKDREVALLRVDAKVDGLDRSFRVTVVPLKHRMAEVLLHVEELTEAVEAEARMQRTESLAQLGSLSAAVAHELRNPLAGISGAIQVIAGSLEDRDRRRPVMDKVLDQIGRLNRLVTDLLAYARPKEPSLQDLDLRTVTDTVAELVVRGRPGLSVEVHGAGHAWADSDLVHRVLLNLIENAAAMTAGQGKVAVMVCDGGLCVSDDGPGVPPEMAERIFEPFFTTRTQGTGLGLAICSNHARAMGGNLRLVEADAADPFAVMARRVGLPGAAFALELRKHG